MFAPDVVTLITRVPDFFITAPSLATINDSSSSPLDANTTGLIVPFSAEVADQMRRYVPDSKIVSEDNYTNYKVVRFVNNGSEMAQFSADFCDYTGINQNGFPDLRKQVSDSCQATYNLGKLYSPYKGSGYFRLIIRHGYFTSEDPIERIHPDSQVANGNLVLDPTTEFSNNAFNNKLDSRLPSNHVCIWLGESAIGSQNRPVFNHAAPYLKSGNTSLRFLFDFNPSNIYF